jgi:hypothetical protein
MKRTQKKLALNRETLMNLSLIQGAAPPSRIGSDCDACITLTIPDTGVTCMTSGCQTGGWSDCQITCTF